MNACMPRSRALFVAVGVSVMLAGTPGTMAAVTAITAALKATVGEQVGGQPGSTDESIEDYPATSPTLPIEALAGLGDFSTNSELHAGGRAVATFDDPTQPDDPNPREFGVEGVSYSLNPSVAYDSAAEASEVRTIVLTPEELGVGEVGDERLSVSTAFLEGAILVWTNDSAQNLNGLSADFDFRIVQVSTTGTETVVFEAELTVTGEPGGDVGVVHSSVLDVQFGGPEVLAGVGGSGTQEVVSTLADIGRVHVILLPTQPVQYAYLVVAGEEFQLRAETTCRAINLPAGTGAAAVFGRPFADLGFALTPFTGEAKAAQIQDVVNQAMRTQADDGGLLSPLCGAFGVETPLLLGAGLVHARRRRHG